MKKTVKEILEQAGEISRAETSYVSTVRKILTEAGYDVEKIKIETSVSWPGGSEGSIYSWEKGKLKIKSKTVAQGKC